MQDTQIANLKAIASTDTAALSPKVNGMLTATIPASGNQTTNVYYVRCTVATLGAKVGYWDSVAGAPVYLNVGQATGAGATC